MPDASDNKVTVAGVEPTIKVRYVGNVDKADTNSRIDLYQSDEGLSRYLSLNGDAVYITPAEYVLLGKYQIESVEDQKEVVEEPVETKTPEVVNPYQTSVNPPVQG